MTANTKYVIDTHAWLEYFAGSPKGKNVKQYIESGSAITPTVVLAELSNKYARDRRPYFQQDLNYILEMSEIAPLSAEIALPSGAIKNEMRQLMKDFGLIDSMIVATARYFNAKVVTGDPHFSGLDESIMI